MIGKNILNVIIHLSCVENPFIKEFWRKRGINIVSITMISKINNKIKNDDKAIKLLTTLLLFTKLTDSQQ